MAEKIKNPNKFASFMKRNLALVIIVACVLAIITIVVVESVNKPLISRPPVDIGGGGGAEIVDAAPSSWTLPLADYTISMDFATGEDFLLSSTLNEWTNHEGIDFVAKGSKDVFAIADGTIESIATTPEHGTMIVVNHGGKIKSTYSSLAENVSVAQGAKVKKGAKIGEASDSAYTEFKDGAHVHLEMTKNDVRISPRDYLEIK